MDDGAGYATNPNEVDHKAKAYVAPIAKKPLVPSNTDNSQKGIITRNDLKGPIVITFIKFSRDNTGSYKESRDNKEDAKVGRS